KPQDDVEVRAAPTIDRLIVVADDANTSISPEGLSTGNYATPVGRPDHDQASELVLNPVRILKFIDHHVAESLVIVVANLGHPGEQLDGLDQEVVKVQRVGLSQPRFVGLVDLRYLFNAFSRVLSLIRVSSRSDPSILRPAYSRQRLP